MDLCVLLAPQQDINWEEITPAVPCYGHWECAFPWEIACIRSRRSNKNQGHWCAEIDSVGALVSQILRTLYWIRNRSGTSLIFFSVFLKFTFLNFFLMYLQPSSKKWFPQAWPSLCTVKILAIKSIGPNLDQVVRFLTCFPCTEKLLIEVKLLSY